MIDRRSSIRSLHRGHNRHQPRFMNVSKPNRNDTERFLSRRSSTPSRRRCFENGTPLALPNPCVPPVCINVSDRCRLIAGIVVEHRAISFSKIKIPKNVIKKKKKEEEEIQGLCCFWKMKMLATRSISCVLVSNPLVGNIFEFWWLFRPD